MAFIDERAAFEQEFDAYYASMPNDVSGIERHLADAFAAEPGLSSYRGKTIVYEAISERCPVHVFRHFPFCYEVGVGKPRSDLGSGGVGSWIKRQPFGQELEAAGGEWWRPCNESGLSLGWLVLDDNHHCLGMDNVFRHGLDGLIARADERRSTADDDEREFLDSMIAGLRAQKRLAERFADEAERMLATEDDPVVRNRLATMSRVYRRIPAAPPETFHEALATILFMRETTQSLEGNGISIIGHLDRILAPYYDADLAAGRIARDAAKDLLAFFLAKNDARFGMRDATNHVGTNGTVMIGGCGADGVPIFNDITRMVAEVYDDFSLVDPKLNVRVSGEHPTEYFDLLADLMADGCNSLSIFNDDVVIPANVKMGKALADCRIYVGGGCQENVLENTEINSRATIYMSLAAVFLMGFFPDRWAFLSERDGIRIRTYDDCATFDEVYDAFLANLEATLRAHIEFRNEAERVGTLYNPCPLHSATIDDCIENARDIMAGGARYSFGSVSLAGIGTLIDSLYAVRETVFEKRDVPFEQLRDMLDSDFDGEEAFRRHMANRIPKYGHDDPAIREFSARVFEDVARVSRGHKNARGGCYEASLFSFRTFTNFGHLNGATPDGRRAGEHLSPGMSPSMIALGRECGASKVLRALEPLDMTAYPVVAVLDVKMPVTRTRHRPDVLSAVMRCFVDYGGSVLQVNLVDPAVLLEAREHPERHPDLVVRISGYSAYFRTLTPEVRDEVIGRTLVSG